ncbi:MAG: PIN domain-containing protein [Candidatus Limnocylindrales bacterium]
MIAVDSSVVIAAFATWHSAHDEAAEIIRGGPELPAHAGLESYSVLTRLPEPTRASPDLARAFLERAFPRGWLVPLEGTLPGLVAEFARVGIAGGATWDGLIAATARAAGATLVTCDRRARPVYERLGVSVRFIG